MIKDLAKVIRLSITKYKWTNLKLWHEYIMQTSLSHITSQID